MYFKYERQYDERIAEAGTPEQAYFAIWQEWPSEGERSYTISELPEDQAMMMTGDCLMFPGFELVDAYRFRELIDNWNDRYDYKEAVRYSADDPKDIDKWNRSCA